eukprot:TRINITY_DN8153_c0_g1_i2.p1 TRINITY_DN8153_c0_g1~~TRINITY_DN8153_c0_g1_i2.p1  ORF type:complete len:336 (+),score=124.56 TRINITY_DN8153_c0_g1_i2:107-1114(+)
MQRQSPMAKATTTAPKRRGVVGKILATVAVGAVIAGPVQHAFVGSTKAPSMKSQHMRGTTARNFFDKLGQMFGMSDDPVEDAQQKLEAMKTESMGASDTDLSSMKTARPTVNKAQTALDDALDALRAAREEASKKALSGWNENETAWDTSLTALADNVCKKAAAVNSASTELKKVGETLASACKVVADKASARDRAAQEVVNALEEEQRGQFKQTVQDAAQGLTSEKLLKTWVLCKAEASDAASAGLQATELAKVDAKALVEDLRKARSEKKKIEEEKIAKAKAEAEAKAKESQGVSFSGEGDDENVSRGAALGLIAAAVAGGYFYTKNGKKAAK